jgi:hypothetical protein
MLSPEEHSYLQKKPLKRLTYDGVNDLYLHPILVLTQSNNASSLKL